MKEKTIVISGANLFSGGTLSIIQDCLVYLDDNLSHQYRIIALVYNKDDYKNLKNIELIEFRNARDSYLQRLRLEYIYYKKLSTNLNPYLWFSLNDMSSNVTSTKRAVYCHNPLPFSKVNLSNLINEPAVFFFSIFYNYLYRINIKKNNYVVVQQEWLKLKFQEKFGLPAHKIIIAPPQSKHEPVTETNIVPNQKKTFCFPTLARPFKNIEVICKAVALLAQKPIPDFEVIITIDGTENPYSHKLLKEYGDLKQLKFIGKISREEVFQIYQRADCLIFPSKIETWGLPLSEFKSFNKPIILADFPYAIETIQGYNKALFFNADDYVRLGELMRMIINNYPVTYDDVPQIPKSEPRSNSWQELFELLLDKTA